ncbi:hypothetical protein DEU38_1024 [Rhodococcus sp. AG1013]|nr:hypothetical protein DEU38_1024 [Rhodococcus sp. AG1013]
MTPQPDDSDEFGKRLPPPSPGAHTEDVAESEHPQRTPFYGVLMIIAALAAAIAVSYYGPTWFRITVYILAVPVVAVGFVMTLRDYSR